MLAAGRPWVVIVAAVTICLPLDLFALAAGLAALDIAGAVADDHLGLVTSRAIREVQNSRDGSGDIGTAVARTLGQARWAAFHADDDSFSMVAKIVYCSDMDLQELID